MFAIICVCSVIGTAFAAAAVVDATSITSGSHPASIVDETFTTTTTDSNNDQVVTPKKFLGFDYTTGEPIYLPLLGIGTWQYDDDTAYESVCKAFSVGYTFVDTAYGYKNQKGVGRAIQDCWKGTREELFVMTKIPGGLNSSQVHEYHSQNLIELGLEYVDHLMVHYPSDWEQTPSKSTPKTRQEEWLALEDIYKRGDAKTIGISHYCTRHILDITEVATVVLPAINQVEYHVGSQDIDSVMDTCSDFGITFMSFSPLCGPCSYDKHDSLVTGDVVTQIAKQYNHTTTDTDTDTDTSTVVTGSQVALRYIVQQGIPVIPKSNTLSHIISNQQIFDFVLSNEHMEQLKHITKPAAESGDCDVAAVADLDAADVAVA